MKKILLVAAAAASLLYAKIVGGPMDGTTWDIKLKPESFFSFSHRQTLTFERGQFRVSGYLASNFSPSIYSAQSAASGDVDAVWNASLTNGENGILSWNGVVRGDEIEGVAVWWKKGGKLKRFTFKGSRKTA